MKNMIILASSRGVRKEILNKNGITCDVIPANIDEDSVKKSLIKEGADPSTISKNLAELKSIKISSKEQQRLVLSADSVVELNGCL